MLIKLLDPLYRWITAYMGACGFILYGSKGGDVAAPDPALIAAQIKSMGIQDTAIQDILGLSKEMQPIQQEQMKFGLESARTAFDQAQADREYSLERRGVLSGMQDTLVNDAKDFNSYKRQEQLAGRAMSDVNSAFSNTRSQNNRAMARMGVNPASGRALALGNQTAIAQAATGAGAINNAREAGRKEGYALTDRATNALAGYPAMGMQNTGNAAQFAAGGLGLANSGMQGMAGGLTAAGNMAGQMGQNATSMYGQQANFYTQNQSQDTLGGLLGGAGGLAMGLAKFSDRRLKENLEIVGKDERTGLNLYEFNYTSDPDTRYVGVMSDEVREVMPQAVQVDFDGFDRVDYGMLGIEMKEVA